MYENAAFCKMGVNLIKIDYSGDPKSCLENKFCIFWLIQTSLSICVITRHWNHFFDPKMF